jgi:hypothetical protein
MVTRLFVVHGMGVHDAQWVDPVTELLTEIYDSYEVLSSVEQSERFTIHPIRYDDILSDLVAKWQADSNAISKLATDVSATLAEALVGWLKTAGTGFQWTHAADVLLYRCFADVREAVQVTVARQIATVINDDLNDVQQCRWAVLAHSLGTSVAHDALHALWTSELDGNRFRPADLKANFVMMLANVSRVLETNIDVLKSAVQPGRASNKTRGCLNFITVRHFLDPFTIPRMFDPMDWPDAQTVKDGRFVSLRLRHFRDTNIHGLTHYLQHPAVHVPLLRLLANDHGVISRAEAERALTNFTAFGDFPADLAASEIKRLELIQPARSDDWKKFGLIWDAFFSNRGGDQ